MNVQNLLMIPFKANPVQTDWLDLVGRCMMAGMLLGGLILFIVVVTKYQPPKD